MATNTCIFNAGHLAHRFRTVLERRQLAPQITAPMNFLYSWMNETKIEPNGQVSRCETWSEDCGVDCSQYAWRLLHHKMLVSFWHAVPVLCPYASHPLLCRHSAAQWSDRREVDDELSGEDFTPQNIIRRWYFNPDGVDWYVASVYTTVGAIWNDFSVATPIWFWKLLMMEALLLVFRGHMVRFSLTQ